MSIDPKRVFAAYGIRQIGFDGESVVLERAGKIAKLPFAELLRWVEEGPPTPREVIGRLWPGQPLPVERVR